jgi:hypothetical protein
MDTKFEIKKFPDMCVCSVEIFDGKVEEKSQRN